MQPNAILLKPLGIESIYVDLSNINNINGVLGAKRISTIHTKDTQKISNKLGIRLLGFINQEGNYIFFRLNN